MFRGILIAITVLFGFGSSLSADDSDKEKVGKSLEEFVHAFNAANPNDISSLLTPNVTFTSPMTGETLRGRGIVTQFFIKGSALAKGSQLVFIATSLEFPSAENAIVEGAAELREKGKIIRRQARRVELVKQNGKWLIDSIKQIDVQLPPDMFRYLKDLAWLVGDWKDSDPHVKIEYATKWDKYKNFLIQHYRIETYGVEVMEGLQIIGWDPAENKIRSWIYDSDGGFGSGTWSKKGDSWYATLYFTLSTGERGTLTNVYTPRDNKSYIYSSIEREIGGKKLPNIEPVIVVKEG